MQRTQYIALLGTGAHRSLPKQLSAKICCVSAEMCVLLCRQVHSEHEVLALGRNASALERLVKLDAARVVAVTLKSGQAPLEALKAALGEQEVSDDSFVMHTIP